MKDRTLPWSRQIKDDLNVWLPSNSYTTKLDLAHELDIRLRIWEEVMLGRPIGDIYVYAKLFLRTGLESCDPRKIPRRRRAKLKPLSERRWKAWLNKQPGQEGSYDEVKHTEGLVSELIEDLARHIQHPSAEFRDALLASNRGKFLRLSTLLNVLLIEDSTAREKQISFAIDVGRITHDK